MTPLPGIGVRKDFALRSGRRVGVVSHRDGKLALIVSKADDPDATLAELPLTTDEAGALSTLLGAPQLVAQLAEEQRDLPGIRTGRLTIASGSPYDGRTLGDRVSAAGYAWSSLGENIAAGYPGIDAVMDGWIASPGHCANLMNAGFTEVGVVCVPGAAGATYSTYWTMDLGRPR